jgi:oligoribonuclease
MTVAVPSRIVWIDTETTGLEPDARLLEVACIITDFEFTEIAEPYTEVIHAPRRALRKLDPYVRNMHTQSGLIYEVPQARRMKDVEDSLLHYIQTYVPDARTAPLGGSSIHVDRVWLQHNMPRIVDHLHYRLIDVSTIMQFARVWYPDQMAAHPVPTGGHRALGDIRDSIASMRYYRQIAFRD